MWDALYAGKDSTQTSMIDRIVLHGGREERPREGEECVTAGVALEFRA